MKKNLEWALYGVTVFVCFWQSAGDFDTSNVRWYIQQKSLFYIIETALLVAGLAMCIKLNYKYNEEHFQRTEKIFAAAETCFVLIVIVAGFSVVAMVPIFVFKPKNVFEHGAANGLLVLLLITALVFLFYTIVTKRFDLVKKKRAEIQRPLGEKPADFFAFSFSADKKQEETAPADTADISENMPEVTELFDETVPDEEEFQRHLQQIALLNHNAEPVQLWECPYCGSLNPDDSGQCGFCGADRDNNFSEQ